MKCGEWLFWRWLMVLIYYCIVSSHCVNTLGSRDIVFVILSQADKYHVAEAEHLQQSIVKQFSSLTNEPPIIKLLHEDFPHAGAWTIVPILPWLVNLYGSDTLWTIFLEENTVVNVKELILTLEQYDPKESLWMGHAIHDDESTVIHHFAFSDNPTKFEYPLFASGFVMSMSFIKRLVSDNNPEKLKSDFTIDASHEFALYVKKPLLNLPSVFCLNKNDGCATFPRKFTRCDKPVSVDNIYFAVKTCLAFHDTRIPIVKDTWGKHAEYIEFFSHLSDKDIPTTDVGVKNTERGHCAKTFVIFRLVVERAKMIPTLQWLILADDDTLLSVPRLQELLTCWNSSEPVAIGERYGYNVKDEASGGYNYLTGGGGIAISIVALKSILQHCSCYQIDAPDDMYLGICLARLNIPVIHSPEFHQARPNDYATDYLAVQKPVSFHKHWMIDPITTYKEWFGGDDAAHKHIEL